MATLRELSEITGYSIATISRVLNGDETLKVTQNTRAMILAAAGKADYPSKQNVNKKNSSGMHLKLGIVEMVTAQESEKDPYYLYVKNNVEKCCFANGMETFVMQYDEEGGCYRSAVSRELDGILAIGQFREDQIVAMEKCTSRIVFLESAPFPEKFCSVMPNYEVGIRQGVDYLIELGHRKVVFVGPEFSTDSTCRQAPELRRKIFADYMGRYGKRAEGILLDAEWQGDDVAEQIMQYVKEFQEEADRPTAFFTYNETTALGVFRALQILGYQVPGDFSILSYNDTVLATMMQPQLSGIHIHIEEMVKQAVWLMERMAKGEGEIPLRVSVPATLVVRESVQPA